jgi:hypothetical protein
MGALLDGRGSVHDKPLHWAQTVHGVLFVLLDTTIPGEDFGTLDDETIA